MSAQDTEAIWIIGALYLAGSFALWTARNWTRWVREFFRWAHDFFHEVTRKGDIVVSNRFHYGLLILAWWGASDIFFDILKWLDRHR